MWAAVVTRAREFESYYWSSDNIRKPVELVVFSLDTYDENNVFLSNDEGRSIGLPFDEFYLSGLFTQHVSCSIFVYIVYFICKYTYLVVIFLYMYLVKSYETIARV